MNLVYASTYLYLPQFLPSMTYSFLSTGLLPAWLNLFLGTFFVAIVNGIDFLVSLFDNLLSEHKNAIDFWVLILYPATLLNLLG